VARRDGQARFTALLHQVDVESLRRAFKRQRRAASPGVDGVTVDEYEQNLEENLERLHARVHSGQLLDRKTSVVLCGSFVNMV
jgi:hypothetical protein